MRSIKKARLMIEADPLSQGAQVFASLISSLESDSHFDVTSLYALDLKHFDLAMNVLKDWRVDRYYMGKAKIFDIAMQAKELHAQAEPKG